MAHFSERKLLYILEQLPKEMRPVKAIETGTWRGDTTALLAEHFQGVITIEPSESLHWRATQRFVNHDRVCCMLGNSGELLPKVAEEKPMFFYLDAHGGEAGGMVPYDGEGSFPLWEELAYINTRPYVDIVVIDDVASFGYHSKEPRWKDVTLGSCVDALGRVARAEIVGDQLVMYRMKGEAE